MPTLQVAINATRARVGAGVFAGASNQIVREAKNSVRHLSYITERTNSLDLALRRAAKGALILVGGISAIQATKSTISIMSEFSREMATLQGVTRATADEIEALTVKARELGRNTIFTAPEAAQGLVFLSRAGFDAKQAIDAIDATLSLATSSMLDMGTAANIVANTINQFDLSTTEANRVADILVVTTNKTNTNMLELGQAMEYVGPVAAALGKDLEETSALLGILADRGIKASIAGTNLRGISAQLAAPLGRQKKVLDDLGVSLDRVNPITNSFADAFETLRAAGMGATEAVLIFGRRNFNSALVIAANTQAVKDLEEELRKTEGTARENADLIEGSLFGAFRKLKSAMNDAALAVGKRGVEGTLISLAGVMTDTVKLFFNIDDAAGKMGTTAVFLSESLRVLLALSIAFVGVKLAGVFYAIAAAIIPALVGLAELRIGLYLFYSAIGPAGWVVLGVTAVVAVLFKLNDMVRDNARDMKRLREETELLGKANTDLSGETEKFQKIFIRMKLAAETFDLSGQVQQMKVFGNELNELLVKFTEKGDSVKDGFVVNTVDVEQLRKVFGEAGKESIDAYLKTLLEADVADRFYSGVSSDFLQRRASSLSTVKQAAVGFNKEIGDLFDVDIPDKIAKIEKIPLEAAIRLLKEQISLAGDETELLTAELERFEAALKQVGAEEILGEFLDELKLERELIGKSKDEQEKILAVRKLNETAIENETSVTQDQIKVLIDAIEANQDLRKIEEGRIKAEKETERLAKERESATKRAVESINELILRLTDQNAQLRVEGLEREKLIASQQINNILRDVEIEGTDELRAKIIALVEEQFILNEGIKEETENRKALEQAARQEKRLRDGESKDRIRAAEDLDEMNRQIQEEINLLGRTTDARQIARKTAEFHSAALKVYGGDLKVVGKLTEEFRLRLVKLAEERRLVQLADDIGDAFGRAFEDVIFGVKSVQEAIENMLREVFRLLFQELVTRQLVSFASGLIQNLLTPNAKGNVFVGGSVKAFAAGGIVNGPTLFPMANGVGLMGEAGPEAIMPLARTSTGELGIKSQGSNGGVSITVNLNGVRDFNSFRENSSQLQAALAQAVSGGRG